MELYWGGLNGSEISKYLGIPHKTAYYWINRFGSSRERKVTPEAMECRPLKARLIDAADIREWVRLLREFPDCPQTGEPDTVRLICGETCGLGQINNLAAIVMDRLRIDPCNGETFAFSSTGHDTISTLQWVRGGFRLTKIPKSYGTYLWPSGRLGASVKLRASEFDFLISYQKARGCLAEKR